MIVYVIYYYVFAGYLAPVSSTIATVLVKRHYASDIDIGDGDSDKYFPGGIHARGAALTGLFRFAERFASHGSCHIIFEIDGERREFSVPMSVYIQVSEGDRGLLEHKGNFFRSFTVGEDGWSAPGRTEIRKV